MKIRLIMFLYLLAGLVAIFLFPLLDRLLNPNNTSPGLITFIGVGTTLSLVTAFALSKSLQSKVGPVKKFFYYAIGYNIIIVYIKFSLAPLSLYRNPNTEFRTTSGINGNLMGALSLSLIAFMLYVIVFFIIYRIFHQKYNSRLKQTSGRLTNLSKLFIMGFLAIAILWSGYYTLIFLLISNAPLNYFFFVFSTGLSSIIAICLVVAISLATLAFKSINEQREVVKKAALLATFFGIGVTFLFIYHVLWAVYFVILTTFWPLRTFSSK